MDKSEIFTELTRRNAVRREAKLPLLDMRVEFDHAVEVTAWREACVKHADDIARIKHGALAEFRARRGADFPQSVGGQWMVRFEATKRILAMLAERGVHPPSQRHSVVYDSDRLRPLVLVRPRSYDGL
jgi:hypothetical protein